MEASIGKLYRHYKNGNEYRIIGIARHSETTEEMVVYEALYASEFGKNALWVRPKVMFEESVLHEGVMVPRFKLIDGEEEQRE